MPKRLRDEPKKAGTAESQPLIRAIPDGSKSTKSSADPFDLDAMFASVKTEKAKALEASAKAQRKATKALAKDSAAAEAAAAKVRELEAVGRKANRIKGADSPTPLRCVTCVQRLTSPLDAPDGCLCGSHFDRVDADGLPIYSSAQLGIGKGSGDTPLCPFDCTCCF
jgi:hypothetical protein